MKTINNQSVSNHLTSLVITCNMLSYNSPLFSSVLDIPRGLTSYHPEGLHHAGISAGDDHNVLNVLLSNLVIALTMFTHRHSEKTTTTLNYKKTLSRKVTLVLFILYCNTRIKPKNLKGL